MFGKMVAKPGQRDALVEHLLEASRLLTPLPGSDFCVEWGKSPTCHRPEASP